MPSHLTDWFRLVLEASWQSSLIVLLILLVRLLMGKPVPARWRYLLWTLVLMRLLVPISLFPSNPVSIQNLAVVDRPFEQVTSIPPLPEEMERQNFLRQDPESSAPASEFTVAPSSVEPTANYWWSVASAIWLVGWVVSLGAIIFAHGWFWRRLRTDCVPVDPAISRIWDECCRRLRIKRPPILCMTRHAALPALVGLTRPVLLLPMNNASAFSPADWENIFVHELAHYRRADHWVHAVQLLAQAVHWFNPMVWLGFRQFRADREIATDEWALQHLGPESSVGYGETLLKVLAQSSGNNLSIATVGILEDRMLIKQRLRRIVGFGPRTLIGSVLGAGLVLAVAAVVLGRALERVDLSDYSGLKPNEIFVTAAKRGDIPVLRKMLRDGLSVNASANVSGQQTAFYAAVANNQPEAMRFLFSKGADINLTVDQQPTPLRGALKDGWIDLVPYLLAHGAKGDPAWVAAARGDAAAIEPILNQQPADLNRLKDLCRFAAVNGHADLFRHILEKIQEQPDQGSWHLEDASALNVIARGHRDVVEAILKDNPSFQEFTQNSVMRLGAVAAQTPGMRDWLISKGFTISLYTDGERLIDAAEQENVPEMARLLKAGVDINYLGESSWTPITKAAAWNKVLSIRFLLAHEADPNSVHIPACGYTGICLTGKPEIADMLFAAGGKVDAPLFGQPHNLMAYAMSIGHTEMVKWFLNHGVDPKNAGVDSEGRTYLFEAGSPGIAEMLIQHGINVNARAKDGSTALGWICLMEEHPAEIARVLLQHGADPNMADNHGTTPIMRAKDGATVEVLVQYGANIHAKADGMNLVDASDNMADATRIVALIKHGASFDPKTDGPRLMVTAAWSNQVDILAYLLKRGIDPNIKGCWNKRSNDYMYPLTAAVVDGQDAAARFLVEHGALIQHPAAAGTPAFDEMNNALGNRRINMVKLFWDHGDRNISPLTYAISQGAPVADVQKLLDQGNSPNPKDNFISPLALAAEFGELDIVKLLVQRGAQINPSSDDPPLQTAAGEGQDEVVDFLLRHGAVSNDQTLWIAVWNCNPYPNQRRKDHFEKTIKLLIDAGGLKGISERQSNELLCAAIFSRYPSGNTTVVKMLLDHGLSFHARNPKGMTVLQLVHNACKEETCQTPTKEMLAFLAPYEKASGE